VEYLIQKHDEDGGNSMTSTFMGLEISRRGMVAQQTALSVIGQNVSNANTPGYSRQVVNLQATDAYPAPGMNAPAIAGQLGSGVEAGSISRVRDNFLDVQYRTENNQLGYWKAQSDSLSQMESILNEPSDTGLSNAMDQFSNSLQDLSTSPTDSSALAVVRQRGVALADTFNYLSNSLSSIQNDQKTQVQNTVDQINSDLDQLKKLNDAIGNIEANGNLPNDLYDQRDKLLDDLSSFVNIKVDFSGPSRSSNPTAEGKATVSLMSDNGTTLGNLLDQSGDHQLSVNYDGASYNGVPSIKTISLDGVPNPIVFSTMNSSGKLKSLIESYGYDNNGTATGTYTDRLMKLDQLAYNFATEFNKVQQQGKSPNVLNGTSQSVPAFFSDGGAGNITQEEFASKIQVSSEIQNVSTGLGDIATAGPNGTLGDATNVLALANVVNETDFQNQYRNVIGQLGVEAQKANQLADNSTALQQSADQKRQSVSSVSINEEMTNMIQYQHAYSASAKMISIQNDILDTIINGMVK
jgi:flagellar hook-associated protein 1 FlgK